MVFLAYETAALICSSEANFHSKYPNGNPILPIHSSIGIRLTATKMYSIGFEEFLKDII